MAKISVALATFNGGAYLQDQLASIASQTLKPNELVVSDDCSTDNTLEILQRFSASASFDVIISVNNRTHGYSSNFNRALMKTTGDIVFLCDQDDVWFPEKIKRITELAATDENTAVFMNDAAFTDAHLRDTGLTKLGQINSAGLGESSFVMGCCAAIRRCFLDFCLPIPDGFPAHDNWLVGIAIGLERRRIVHEVLQYYRRHGENESSWIVNRTTRVTRWHTAYAHWRALTQRSTSSKGDVEFDKLSGKTSDQTILNFLKGELLRCPESYKTDVSRYLTELEQKTKTNAYRESIRNTKVTARFNSVFKYWCAGGYDKSSGIKSAIRDLLG